MLFNQLAKSSTFQTFLMVKSSVKSIVNSRPYLFVFSKIGSLIFIDLLSAMRLAKLLVTMLGLRHTE